MSNILRIVAITIFLGGLWLSAAHAQRSSFADRRFDFGYDYKGYGYSYVSNPDYSGPQYLLRKGFLTASFKEYLTRHLYIATDARYLLNSHRTFLFGGPLDFDEASLGMNIGFRYRKYSFYIGASGGLLWDYRIQSIRSNQTQMWIDAVSPDQTTRGALQFGLSYYLTPHVSLTGEISHTSYYENEIRPLYTPHAIPAFKEAAFSDISASIGISFGIPWKSKDKTVHRNPRPASKSSSENTVGSPPSKSEAPLKFTSPLAIHRTLTSGFGDNRGHQGWDLDLHAGDTIRASAPGTVTRTTRSGAYGIMVEVTHIAGFSTRYAHLSDILVKEGQNVSRGAPIGLGGRSGSTTGSHLHFELLYYGRPVNPAGYINLE